MRGVVRMAQRDVLRPQVRARYAEGARALTAGGAGEVGCGEPCCTAAKSGVLDEEFGARSYGLEEPRTCASSGAPSRTCLSRTGGRCGDLQRVVNLSTDKPAVLAE